ncbi:MAG TPA: site-2 protease family protein [Burkholderiaceae bacterium]|jgi:Zn-dependent protease|nr:site-2 protease family protein [Burkholderiaceae bacterium]
MSRIFLLLIAALKFGKLVPTVLSLLLAVGVYTLVFGWRYAVGIVAMLLIHEMGHYIAARQRGLAVRLPMFIPFAFAWTTLEELPHDAETEAYIGLGGPMLGTVGAIAAWWLGHEYDVTWLLAVASTGFFLNLINMIPLPPLDGGRITTVLSPRIWLLGVPIIGALLWFQFSLILLLIAILAVPHVIAAFRFDPTSSPEAQRYHDVSPRTRWEYGLIYVGLIAFLAYMTNDLHRELRGIRAQQTEQTQSGDV